MAAVRNFESTGIKTEPSASLPRSGAVDPGFVAIDGNMTVLSSTHIAIRVREIGLFDPRREGARIPEKSFR